MRAKPWALAVDFGTSNTTTATATVGDPSSARPVVTEGGFGFPSAVLAYQASLTVGQRAVNGALARPDAFEPTPKRRLGEGSIRLGDRDFTDVELVARVLGEAASGARRLHNDTDPAEVRLTYPAAWMDFRRSRLVEAAEAAGLINAVLVPEPVAAATYYTQRERGSAALPNPGDRVAVFDLGGGTLDIAVLRAEDDGIFHVIEVGGRPDLGGETFDALIEAWIQDELGELRRDDLAAEIFGHHDDPEAAVRSVRARLTLVDRIRRAKHELSDYPYASIRVEVGHEAVELQLNRERFEELIRKDIAVAGDVLTETLQAAQVDADELSGLFLTGGSSLVPLLARKLFETTGVTPARFDDPKVVTVTGALAVKADLEDRTSSERARPAPTFKEIMQGTHEPDLEPPATTEPARPASSDSGDMWYRAARTIGVVAVFGAYLAGVGLGWIPPESTPIGLVVLVLLLMWVNRDL